MTRTEAPARNIRVLEIVTVPFFAPRGTSFSSLERTRALSDLGFEVEVLTYPIGEDVDLPGVTVHRTLPLPGVRTIKMGPSLPKLYFDLQLVWMTFWRLVFRRYDLVHVHEESAYWMALFRKLHKGPVLYDMHSCLSEQLGNFGYQSGGGLRRLFGTLDRKAIAMADALIVICKELEDTVKRFDPLKPKWLIENLPVGWDCPPTTPEAVRDLKKELGINDQQVVLYTGTFGKNQGLELLIDAMAQLRERQPPFRLCLVGGSGADMERIRGHVASRDMDELVILQGPVDYQKMPTYMAMADLLASPRTAGTNTPLKIYAYLVSRRPLIATDLHTHTQTLDQEVARLVAPEPSAWAEAISSLLDDPSGAEAMATRAFEFGNTRFGIDRYRQQVRDVLEFLLPGKLPPCAE